MSITSSPNATVSELIAHWRLQEALFQGYRRLFITLELGLLSVASLSLSINVNTLSVPAQAAILAILCSLAIGIFFKLSGIINKRGEIVFFWQALILRVEQGIGVQAPLAMMKQFQDGNPEVRSWPEFSYASGNGKRTRSALDTILPFAIGFVWAAIVVIFIVEKA